MQTLVDLQYWILKKAYPRSPDLLTEEVYEGKCKLDLLGDELKKKLSGKVVVDFGCGSGGQAIEMARRGAARVIGLDIQVDRLEIARRKAIDAGVCDKCAFAVTTTEPVEIIVSLDAFEHFDDPAHILHIMSSILQPGGELIFSFGPTWYHPLGGHFLSVFPWAHVVVSETALCRWRSEFKQDKVMKFNQVAGGLNQMTVSRFEKLIAASDFRLETLECVPIRKLKPIHTGLTREFTTAIVRGRAVKR